MVRYTKHLPWSSWDALFAATETALDAGEFDSVLAQLTRSGKLGRPLTLAQARRSIRASGEPGRIRIAFADQDDPARALLSFDASPVRGVEIDGRPVDTVESVRRIRRAFEDAVAVLEAAAQPEPSFAPSHRRDVGLAGIVGAVFTVLAVLGRTIDITGLLLVGFGLAVALVIWRVLSVRRARDMPAIIGVVFAVVFGCLLVARDDTRADPPTASNKAVEVDNRVTDGARAMREDDPLTLFYVPRLCRSQDCVVPGQEFHTGDKISDVVCQVAGGRITNGNDRDDVDDDNPGLYSSRLWYGVSTAGGRLAYFNEVWARAEDRGGLRLPDCSSASVGARPEP